MPGELIHKDQLMEVIQILRQGVKVKCKICWSLQIFRTCFHHVSSTYITYINIYQSYINININIYQSYINININIYQSYIMSTNILYIYIQYIYIYDMIYIYIYNIYYIYPYINIDICSTSVLRGIVGHQVKGTGVGAHHNRQKPSLPRAAEDC